MPRYKCNDCGGSFSYPFSSLMPGQQFTTRLYDQLKIRAMKEPFTVLSREYGISITKASDILIEHGKKLYSDRRVIAPKVLGIDEKHIVKDKRGVLVDVERGILLEMRPDNKQETIREAIESLINYDKNIKVVTIDMWTGYVSVVQECLPYATIVVDKFHVVQLINKRVEKTRKKLYAYLKNEVEKMEDSDEKARKKALLTRLGKNVFLFRYNKKSLEKVESRIKLLIELIETFPELNLMHRLKEGLVRIYEAETRADAEARYVKWTKLIPPKSEELYCEIHTLSRTIKNWHKYIFNYFDKGCGYTNAATEGVNLVIDMVNKSGYGYGFEALRTKALYYSNEKYKQKTREKAKKYNFKAKKDSAADRFNAESTL